MSSARGKRKAESAPLSSPSKRLKAVETIDLTEDDDEVAAIWAQIEAQQNTPESSGTITSKQHHPEPSVQQHAESESNDDVAAIWAEILAAEKQDVRPVESDEAMARRLEAEWQAAESESPHPSNSSNTLVANASLAIPESLGVRPEFLDPKQALSPHKPLFTQDRECSGCGNPVASLQGYVSVRIHSLTRLSQCIISAL